MLACTLSSLHGKIMAMSTLHERFAAARAEKNLSLQDLGDACGISRTAVGQWESEGGTTPTGPNLIMAAKALDKDPEWLALGTGPEKTGQALPDAIAGFLPTDRLREDIMVKAINKVMTAIIKNSLPAAPQEVSEGVLKLYHHYVVVADAQEKPATVELGGQVVSFPVGGDS